MKNNKIINSRRTTRQTNLENFVLRERLVDKNRWKHYVYQADECALATWWLGSLPRYHLFEQLG